jgi:hypothetical protein
MRGIALAFTASFVVAVAVAAAPQLAVASPQPKTSMTIDVADATVEGLHLGSESSKFVALWGFPDYSGTLQPGVSEMLWSHTAQVSDAWAVLNLKSPSSTTVVLLRYAGLFHTSRGDRRGTSLTTFLRHWPRGHVVTPVKLKGKIVEYNVAIGRVVFAFNTAKVLEAVGLSPADSAPGLCVIPSTCSAAIIS